MLGIDTPIVHQVRDVLAAVAYIPITEDILLRVENAGRWTQHLEIAHEGVPHRVSVTISQYDATSTIVDTTTRAVIASGLDRQMAIGTALTHLLAA
jgi:hypothetical protein